MRFEENVKIYEKYDKIDDIPYGSQVELKLGDRNYITGKYQGLCGGFAIDISGHTYSLSQMQEIKVNTTKEEKFELGDIIEVINVDGLNRVTDCKKGTKNLIGLQGKIIMIDKVSCSSIAYYLVDLPQIQNHYECIVSGGSIFLADNLKLVKKENDRKMKDIYSNKDVGIRKDYLYEIDTKSFGCVLGEILNFDNSKYVVKQYKVNGEFNHYIIKVSDILELHPHGTIKDFKRR